MKVKLSPGQYKLLARYSEDISKATLLYDIVGYFLPSLLPSAIRPTISQLMIGIGVSLTGLAIALILEGKGETTKRK